MGGGAAGTEMGDKVDDRAGGRGPGRLAGVALLAMLVSGCTAYEWAFGKSERPPCPRVSVLAEAATVTKFRDGPGRDLIDILYSGEIGGVRSSCEYDIDDDTGEGTLTVTVGVLINGARGPADRERAGIFEYFVAIPSFYPRPEGRGVFTARLEFPGNLTRNRIEDRPVDLTIPINGSSKGADFNVLVGFQLSREELEYNRRRRATVR